MRLKIILLLIGISSWCKAQNNTDDYMRNLDKLVKLDVKAKPVSEVLDRLSKTGGFFFSYSGILFNQDSIVNVSATNMPVRDVLDRIFDGKVAYKEMGEHVILRYAANHLTIEPENISSNEKSYQISGYVVDKRTGQAVGKASVYEKRTLDGDLTDDKGYFKIRIKGNHTMIILTASKEMYRDTSLVFLSDIKIKPEGYRDKNDEKGSFFFNTIEKSGISRFFLSSKQKFQSLNISGFLANSPFQASFTPGLSSHGIMSSQVINKGSLNIIGGYTAGINGVEIAGLFNITKGNVIKLQIAGGFNGVGGSVEGVQVAGLLNDVRTGVKGVQVAGVVNHVKEDVEGVQIAGVTNITFKGFRGTQIAGVANISPEKTKGTQIAGLINYTAKEIDGVQISGVGNIALKELSGVQITGVFNYAKQMKGLQIGLVNISDYNTGYSIGLINYVHHGYHKISISTDETINANIALKTGNAKLYNIILAGKNHGDSAKILTAGLGFGHDFIFNNKLSVAAEITGQYLYLGNWDHTNFLNRFQANLQYQVFKGITLFAGPVYSTYNGTEGSAEKGYQQRVAPQRAHKISSGIKGWMGWNAGITLM
ncbi:LA_2272 family surface repeat-containing protein [Pedobacter frigoris]|uniref:Carboxypeptidase-like regulatory domain-containing protein n=1 Tax=Pedobacter frigoris TaxID=2571272 RepID=A0A4U1CP82_9SPHI|nr:carboxypeptidase-like regulatory domain-containing protein [Pedobacter frigoris]TKC09293.1 carboxypeptidase-like regulatory domain-containing protein [Pedobacter frigoris]